MPSSSVETAIGNQTQDNSNSNNNRYVDDNSDINSSMNHDNNSSNSNNDDWGEAEWDGTSPFWIHCVAGSIAGVMEHGATYPLDTVRTHIQVCAACIQRNTIAAAAATTTTTSATIPSTTTTTMVAGTNNASATAASSLLLRSSTTAVPRSNILLINNATNMNNNGLPLGMWQTIRYLVNGHGNAIEASTSSGILSSALNDQTFGFQATTATTGGGGFFRLWRGVQTILIGCIPAHALYFSSYETVKHLCTDSSNTATSHNEVPAWGSSLAGAAATFGHDIIMTPLDTIKQRMQIGHYPSGTIVEAIRAITMNESYAALYRSFPITLASNIPYGMIMVTTNETCKQVLPKLLYNNVHDGRSKHHHHHHDTTRSSSHHWYTVLLSSSIAGFIASACTTPLDRIKTALQTQNLAPNCVLGKAYAECPAANKNTGNVTSASLVSSSSLSTKTWYQAAQLIYQTEGIRGFFRGIVPRVLSHTPAVAISWTTYETIKQYLIRTTQ